MGGDVVAMAAGPDQDFADLLRRTCAGESEAGQRLAALVLDELRAIAARYMNGQPPGHTLQPTALVNEAYLRLFRGAQHDFRDRRHFLAVASRAMRQVLVDHARAKGRDKRRAQGERLPLDQMVDELEQRSASLGAVDEALERLARIDPRLVRAVELRFFLGCTPAQTAEILGVSTRTVERDWVSARAWLRRELG